MTGEGGASARGAPVKGKTHRITLGEYPAVTLETARGTANFYWAQAKKGVSPVRALESAATAGGLTVTALGATFMTDYVKMRELRALDKYQMALDVHIVPQLGSVRADLLTREEVREAVKRVMVKQPRGSGPRDRPRGGKEHREHLRGRIKSLTMRRKQRVGHLQKLRPGEQIEKVHRLGFIRLADDGLGMLLRGELGITIHRGWPSRLLVMLLGNNILPISVSSLLLIFQSVSLLVKLTTAQISAIQLRTV